MKLILLSICILLSLNLQSQNRDEKLLNIMVEDFRESIIQHNDFNKFKNLFLHDSITWSAIITGKTLKMAQEQQPDFNFFSGTFMEFFNDLKEGSEEKFYNVKIDVRDEFATISFEYSFNLEDEIQNWGTEYWSLLKINEHWKITSVTWSQKLQKIEKCPFKKEDLFEFIED